MLESLSTVEMVILDFFLCKENEGQSERLWHLRHLEFESLSYLSA